MREPWVLKLTDGQGRQVRTLRFAEMGAMLGFMVKHDKPFRIRKLSGKFGTVSSWEVRHA